MPSSAPIASSSFSPGITALSRLDATKASSRNVLSVPARKGISVPLLACAVRKAASRSDGVDWYWSVAGSLTVVMATRCVLLSDGSVTGAWIWNEALVAPDWTSAVAAVTASGCGSGCAAASKACSCTAIFWRAICRASLAAAGAGRRRRGHGRRRHRHIHDPGRQRGAPPPSEGRAVDRVSLTLFQSSPVVWLMTPK